MLHWLAYFSPITSICPFVESFIPSLNLQVFVPFRWKDVLMLYLTGLRYRIEENMPKKWYSTLAPPKGTFSCEIKSVLRELVKSQIHFFLSLV